MDTRHRDLFCHQGAVMRRILIALCIVIAVGTAMPVHAQGPDGAFPIHVSHTGEDRLGSQFLFQLRKVLRNSPAFVLRDAPDGHLHVALATQAVADTLTAGRAAGSVDVSVYTVTWLFNQKESGATIFIKSAVGYFQREQADTLAESIAGQTGSLVSSLRASTARDDSSP